MRRSIVRVRTRRSKSISTSTPAWWPWSGGTAAYPILTTPNGTPRQVLDPTTGQPLWTWETPEPFGDTPPQSPTGFVFTARFPGQWYDDVTHLAFNGFRDYDAQTGRYAEPDPTGLAAGPNPYAYAGGDPVDNIDPMGLDHHKYVVKDYICSEIQGGCTKRRVFARLLGYSAPFSDPYNAAKNCSETHIPLLGTVMHGVYPRTFTVTNVTMRDHMLYPGKVARTVVSENGNIYILTVGTGDGAMAWLNTELSKPLWSVVDQDISAPWDSTVYMSEFSSWVQ